jgi:hypothetical protein
MTVCWRKRLHEGRSRLNMLHLQMTLFGDMVNGSCSVGPLLPWTDLSISGLSLRTSEHILQYISPTRPATFSAISALRPRDAGMDTTLEVLLGAPHGSTWAVGAKVTKDWTRPPVRILEEALRAKVADSCRKYSKRILTK